MTKPPTSPRRPSKKIAAKPNRRLQQKQVTPPVEKSNPNDFTEKLRALQDRQPKSMAFRAEDRHPRLVRLRPIIGHQWRVHFGATGVEAYRMRERLGLSPSSDTHTNIRGVLMISALTADTLAKLGLINSRDDGSYETAKPPEVPAEEAIHPLGCVVELRGTGEDQSIYSLQATDGDHLARLWARASLRSEAQLTEMAVSLLLTQANQALNNIKVIRDAIDMI